MPKTKEVNCPICGINCKPETSDMSPSGECPNCRHPFRPAEVEEEPVEEPVEE